MHILDIIEAKRDGKALTEEQISFFVEGVANRSFPDYQISAFLMAAFIRGLNEEESAYLTKKMAETGDTVDLGFAGGKVADKHSSGGVGDKTTLAVAPMVAAAGLKVAKMSGRGLGFTGGTLDKLESIPGFSVNITADEFKKYVARDGISVIGQTTTVAPVDKVLYKLRDVTGTVPSIPLIAASIMSKKLAVNSDAVVLDVKTGSGAFMKTTEESITLAEKMVQIGLSNGRTTVAAVTDMSNPLGRAVGNSLEVIEAIDTLRGNGPDDFTELCLTIATLMLTSSGLYPDEESALAKLCEVIADGSALGKLRQMVKNQGGDVRYIDDPDLFEKASIVESFVAERDGYISAIETEAVGRASTALGAGRYTAEDVIDFAAGITVEKKVGDYVKKGDVLLHLYTNRLESLAEAKEILAGAYTINDNECKRAPIVHKIIRG